MATESSVMAVIKASRPSLRNPHDKIAFSIHASFIAAGFTLIATRNVAFSDDPPKDGIEVEIEGWNEMEDAYGFVYTKAENGSKKTVLVKCLSLGDDLMVDVQNLGGKQKEPFHLPIKVKDYTSDSPDSSGGEASPYPGMYKDFQGLVKNLNAGILAKLEPVIESTSSAHSAGKSEHGTTNKPDAALPDEHQPFPSGLVYPPVPIGGGYSDLFPGPGAGFYPARDPYIGGGGMLIGPNDPRFRLGERPGPGFPGGIPPGVPPGARFDPYGPPDVPGFEPSRFVRHPRRPGGGTHPDLEHFQGPDYI